MSTLVPALSPAEYALLYDAHRRIAANLLAAVNADAAAAHNALRRLDHTRRIAHLSGNDTAATHAEAERILATLPPDPTDVIARRRRTLKAAR